MKNREYVRLALTTEPDYGAGGSSDRARDGARLLHGALGVATEAGEILDAVKKHIFYGKPLDLENIAEEIGDLFWYCAILSQICGQSFDEIMIRNLAKLRQRYGDSFNAHRALSRNLEQERAELDGQMTETQKSILRDIATQEQE